MRVLLSLMLLLFISACREADAPAPTATTLRVTAAPMTLPARSVQAVASRMPDADDATPAPTAYASCAPSAEQPAAAHTVTATVDYAGSRVEVEQTARAFNHSNEPFADLVFDAEPNRFPDVFTLHEASIGGQSVPEYELTGRRLTLALAEPLQPGCSLDVRLVFTLQVPPVGQPGISAYGGYFGTTARQFNLGHWLLALAARRGGEWITHDIAGVGEQIVAEDANWDVTVQVENAPDGLLLAAPGIVGQLGENSWRVQLTASRDFTLSLSPVFDHLEMVNADGVTVELFTLHGAEHPQAGEAHALETAADALTTFSDLYGAYPYDRFVVVEGDFPDGMEFTGMVFVSKDWFRTYEGNPASYLTLITAHETAHQWWYARVGSDQALTPWLDEALATYSEYVFLEAYYPDLREWWWGFRVDTFVPADFTRAVDGTVYEFTTIREYINAVYLRGARMLDELRRDLGTEGFFDWLARYAVTYGGRVATPDDLWALLTPAQQEATAGTRAQFLSVSAAGTP